LNFKSGTHRFKTTELPSPFKNKKDTEEDYKIKFKQKLILLFSGQNEMYSLALAKFDLPGEAGFPLNSVYAKPQSQNEADLMKNYLTQVSRGVFYYATFFWFNQRVDQCLARGL
jgi:ARP2/3 complex ARPC3 (21 kDa) subunit.